MDFNLSDLQRMMLDSAQRFIGDRYTLEHRRSLRATTNGLDVDAWQTFAELGWLSILVPEGAGGLGGTLTDAAVLASALGARCVTEPFVSTAIIGATLLTPTEGAQAGLIEAVMAGNARVALAHDEPGERYAYAAPRVTRLTWQGNALVLDGQKMLALDAPSATHLIVTAQAPQGLALALVPAEDTGIVRQDYGLHDGSRAADIRFDGVGLPADALLASGAAAETLLTLALDRARIVLAAQAVGSMEAMLDICSAYLKERHQFGQPIGSF